MPDFGKMYVELYSAVNEALKHLAQGESEEAMLCLLDAQIATIGQLFE